MWLACGAAARLSLEAQDVVVESSSAGSAWLLLSPRLGFRVFPGTEGVLLLDRSRLFRMGSRTLSGARARWTLGPHALPVEAQALVLERGLRPAFSNVLRIDPDG